MEWNWEEFTINITHGNEQDNEPNIGDKRLELTEQFETELTKLIKKYQGQLGLKITGRNSSGETIEN